MANLELMQFLLNGLIAKEKAQVYMQKRILDHYTQYGYGLYAVEKKKIVNLSFVGLISPSIDQKQLIELGYRFHPNYWGRGLATEAALAVCQYAFDQLGIKKLNSIIDPQNFRSLGVAKRAGWLFW
ncbi:GNAT family N-acetyltransferase [Candidatus Protochlamydia amoebophila]|uniref:GNAT family N-acetyltransferase n=1 Tax=Candidatus Protochlamydia amoebophila TaxID=362787 RepID=UPI0024B610D4|nr:GNAT family N-acetyltransferase [Candidatus Protochlamydia amoebophila]